MGKKDGIVDWTSWAFGFIQSSVWIYQDGSRAEFKGPVACCFGGGLLYRLEWSPMTVAEDIFSKFGLQATSRSHKELSWGCTKFVRSAQLSFHIPSRGEWAPVRGWGLWPFWAMWDRIRRGELRWMFFFLKTPKLKTSCHGAFNRIDQISF